ncbi:MAG: hypothetical protein Q8N37_04575 [bacterium]|nr:hypothetical protein [bacterium]
MAKKFVLYFFITLLFSFASIAAQARNITVNSLEEVKNTTDNLKNIENLPSADEIGIISSAIKSAAKTYQVIKTQITDQTGFFQKIFQSLKESWEKIMDGGLKFKNYIEEKIALISKRYEVNSLLA